jgi:hypothetical protein
MPPAVYPIIAGAGLVNSIVQGNAANHAAQSDATQEQKLFQEILNQFQGTAGQNLQNFFTKEMKNPFAILAPELGAQENVLSNQNAQEAANIKASEGSATPNLAGLLSRFNESATESKANLGSAAIGQETGIRQAGATGLMDFINAFSQAMGGVAGAYGQAGTQAAGNAANNNPFMSLFSALSANPGAFDTGASQDWSWIQKLFGHGNTNSATGGYTPQPAGGPAVTPTAGTGQPGGYGPQQ